VLAEDADPGYPRYLGLCFPASDIPRQARELYRVNRIRVIEDADYQPSPLLPAANPRTGKALDMSFAALRSVSPVHLQYMRNMGTLASMSLSIVVDGQLWGLISCHHDQPRAVASRPAPPASCWPMCCRCRSKPTRSMPARAAARPAPAHRAHDRVDGRPRQRQRGLLALPEVMLQFAGASGAAIISAERCDLIGKTPPAQVNALVRWLAERGDETLFHTDNARRDIEGLPELAEHAAGVLAVAISQHSHYLLWFRPEQAHGELGRAPG
jgi:light-regulated signal transduction histidine kinase (bacteriophytochrome)